MVILRSGNAVRYVSRVDLAPCGPLRVFGFWGSWSGASFAKSSSSTFVLRLFQLSSTMRRALILFCSLFMGSPHNCFFEGSIVPEHPAEDLAGTNARR